MGRKGQGWAGEGFGRKEESAGEKEDWNQRKGYSGLEGRFGECIERKQEMAKLSRYYGERVQTLITEMAKDGEVDRETGEVMRVKDIVEKLKLDKQLIQWDDDEEDFKDF